MRNVLAEIREFVSRQLSFKTIKISTHGEEGIEEKFCKITIESGIVDSFDISDLSRLLKDNDIPEVLFEFIGLKSSTRKKNIKIFGLVDIKIKFSFNGNIQDYQSSPIIPQPVIDFSKLISNKKTSLSSGIPLCILVSHGEWVVDSRKSKLDLKTIVSDQYLKVYGVGHFASVGFVSEDIQEDIFFSWVKAEKIGDCNIIDIQYEIYTCIIEIHPLNRVITSKNDYELKRVIVRLNSVEYYLRSDLVKHIKNIHKDGGLEMKLKSLYSAPINRTFKRNMVELLTGIGLSLVFSTILIMVDLFGLRKAPNYTIYSINSDYILSILISFAFGFFSKWRFYDKYFDSKVPEGFYDVYINFKEEIVSFRLDNIKKINLALSSSYKDSLLNLKMKASNPRYIYIDSLRFGDVEVSNDCFVNNTGYDQFDFYVEDKDERRKLEFSKRLYDGFSKSQRLMELKGVHINYLNALCAASKFDQKIALLYSYYTSLYGYSWSRAIFVVFIYVLTCEIVLNQVYPYCYDEVDYFVFSFSTLSSLPEKIKHLPSVEYWYNSARVIYGLLLYQLVVAFRKSAKASFKED